MSQDSRSHLVALSIMAAIVVLNIALAINFISASGRALAAVFTGQTIFLLAGIELVVVLTTYVVSKNRPITAPTRSRAPVM